MKNVSKKVIEKIEKEKIKPTPKWEFETKEITKICLFVLNLVLGAIGTSVIIFLITNNEVVFDSSYVKSFSQWLVLSIPFVWIFLTGILMFLSYIFFKTTKDGYKYEFWKIAIVNVVLSIIIGMAMYLLGYTEKLNNYFVTNIPSYTRYADTRMAVWTRPEQGYLSGTITGIKENGILLIDFNRYTWIVDTSDALVRGRMNITVGSEIKIVGKQQDANHFKASEIRPWMGKMMNF